MRFTRELVPRELPFRVDLRREVEAEVVLVISLVTTLDEVCQIMLLGSQAEHSNRGWSDSQQVGSSNEDLRGTVINRKARWTWDIYLGPVRTGTLESGNCLLKCCIRSNCSGFQIPNIMSDLAQTQMHYNPR